MKRFKFAVAAICAGLIFCPWAPVVADTAELEPAEADRILYLLEFTRFKQEVLAGENALWDATAFNRLANDHQNHVEMLEELASRYELEDTGKYAGNFDILLLNEALRPQWTNWGSWLFDRHDYCKAGAFLEEMNIRDLRNAIRETQEQILIDTYTAILADGYVHLLVLLHQMYDDPYDYDPRLLSREEVDSALLEASALLSLTFEINAGLNDAWFDPARNGQWQTISLKRPGHAQTTPT